MLSYEFFRCTCKDKNSSKRVTMKCTLRYLFDKAHPWNNPACSIPHMESHTFMYKRSFANKVEHNLHPPGILFASLGNERNFHCWSVRLPEAASSITPLLAQKPLFISPTHTSSLAISHQRASPFIRVPDPSTMTHLCKVHKLHHYVRKIVGNKEGSTAKSWSKTACAHTVV